LQDDGCSSTSDGNPVFNDDINVRVVEGRGDSSAENSLIESCDKSAFSKTVLGSATFDGLESIGKFLCQNLRYFLFFFFWIDSRGFLVRLDWSVGSLTIHD